MKVRASTLVLGMTCVATLVLPGCRRAGAPKPPEAKRDVPAVQAAEEPEPAPPVPVVLDPREHEGHAEACPCLSLSPDALATADGLGRFDEWRRASPAAALSWVVRLPAAEAVMDAVGRAAVDWAATEPVEALDAAMRIGNPSLRAKALAAIGASWAAGIGEERSLVTGDALGEGAAREQALIETVTRWAQVDPESAAVWVSAFPTGEVRAASSSKLVRLWSEHDPKAAHAWRLANPL